MLITTQKSETNIPVTPTNFSIKQSNVAFEILSSKLYSEPIKAVIRELLSNAYESHVAAKNEETPIEVTLPNSDVNQFIVRDFGTGLCEEDVVSLYTTFFESTKNGDNTYTGGFGLGSKAPFTYVDNFTITSYFNGTAYFFVASKKEGYPVLYNVNKRPTDEKNGLKVSIPVLEKDIYYFRKDLFNYIRNIPELNIFLTSINRTHKRTEEYIVIKDFVPNITLKFCYAQSFNKDQFSDYYNFESGVFIKQGQNVFKINPAILPAFSLTDNFPYKSLNNFKIIFDVPVGTFPVTPNREELINAEECKEHLNSLIKAFITFVDKDLEEKKLNSCLVKALSLNGYDLDYSSHNTVKWLKGNIQKYCYDDFIRKYNLKNTNALCINYIHNPNFFKKDDSSYSFIPDINVYAKVKKFSTKESFYLDSIQCNKKNMIIVACNEKNKRCIYKRLRELVEDFSSSDVFILNTKDVPFRGFYFICKIVKYFNSLPEFRGNITLLSENKINKLYGKCERKPVEERESKERVQKKNVKTSFCYIKSIANASHSYASMIHHIGDSRFNWNTTLSFEDIKTLDTKNVLVIPTSFNSKSSDFYFLIYLILVCNKYLYCKDKSALNYFIENKKLSVKEFSEYDKLLFVKPSNKKLFSKFDMLDIEEFKCWLQNNSDIYVPFKHQTVSYEVYSLLEITNNFLNLLDGVDEKYREAFYKQDKVKVLKKIRDYYFNKYEVEEVHKANANFRFTVDVFAGCDYFLKDLMNLLGINMASLKDRQGINTNPLNNFYGLLKEIEARTNFFKTKLKKDTLSEIFNLIKEKRNVFFCN